MPGRQSCLFRGVELWIKLQAETNLTIALKIMRKNTDTIPSSPVKDRRASKVCVYRLVAHFVTSLVEVLSINQCGESERQSLKPKSFDFVKVFEFD